MSTVKATFMTDDDLERIVGRQIAGCLDKETIDHIVSNHYGGSFSRFIYELLQAKYCPENGDDIYLIDRKMNLVRSIVSRLERLGSGEVSVGVVLSDYNQGTEPEYSPALTKLMNSIERSIFDANIDLGESDGALATYFIARVLIDRIMSAVSPPDDSQEEQVVCLKLRGKELDIVLL